MMVLVVEDDPKLGPLLVRGLATHDIESDLADTAEVALAMAGQRHYSAALVDQMLPGIDGLQLCRRLRRGGLRAPVVIMSARGDLADQIAPAGANGYLVKPFSFDQLLASLRALPERSRRAPGYVDPTVVRCAAGPFEYAGRRRPLRDLIPWLRRLPRAKDRLSALEATPRSILPHE